MTRPHIQPRFRTFSDTAVLGAIGSSLHRIRDEDRVTNADLASTLVKSPATIERYLAGDRAMPASTFVRGCMAWDGRFADSALGLAGMRLVPIDAVDGTDQGALADLCQVAAQLAAALADGVVTDAERAGMWPAIRHVMAELGRMHRLSCIALPPADTS